MRIRHLTFLVALGVPYAFPAPAAAQRTARAHHVVHRHEEHVTDDVREAPPPPRVVPRPPRPFAGAVWTDGYWTWSGSAFVWIDGAWVHPIPGRRWVPWRWDHQHGHWTLIPGGWVPSHEGPL